MSTKINLICKKIGEYLYPEEIFTLIFLFILFIFFLFNQWQIIFWDHYLAVFIVNRLIFPATVFFIISLFRHILKSLKTKKGNFYKEIGLIFTDVLRIWLLFYFALLLHFNLKIKVPLINPYLFDNFYNQFDTWFFWLLNPIFHARDWLQHYADFAKLYSWCFEGSFLFCFLIIYLKNKRYFREMFFVTILVLVLGGVSYCFFPAIGPFYFSDSHSPSMHIAQEDMYTKYLLYRESNGQIYSPAYLIQGVAAMPSLHIANTFIFLFFIGKYARKFLIVYVPFFFYIAIDAVYTKFHYLLDVIFGLILAFICLYIGHKIYNWRDNYTKKLEVKVIHANL